MPERTRPARCGVRLAFIVGLVSVMGACGSAQAFEARAEQDCLSAVRDEPGGNYGELQVYAVDTVSEDEWAQVKGNQVVPMYTGEAPFVQFGWLCSVNGVSVTVTMDATGVGVGHGSPADFGTPEAASPSPIPRIFDAAGAVVGTEGSAPAVEAAPVEPEPVRRVFGREVAPDGTLLPIPDAPVAGPSSTGPADGCNIKGNVSYETGERIYHVPGQDFYAVTDIEELAGERWFCTEDEAVAAGWRKSHG